MIVDATLLAVFLTGLLGGVHCAGMCGGIVGALSMLGRRAKPVAMVSSLSASGISPSGISLATRTAVPLTIRTGTFPSITATASRLSTPLCYNVGRISMYTTLGFLAGSLGSLSFLLEHALPVQQGAYLASSLLLILMGVYLAGAKRVALVVESVGQPLWRLIKPYAVSRMQLGGSVNLIATGALWGLVPCGMVYGVLTMALVAGDGISGALLMFAFGLGTLPNLLLLGVAGGMVKRVTSRVWIRRSVGAVIIAFGVLGLLRLNSIAAQVNDLPLLRDLCRVIN